jgi:NADH dehydrogenase
MNNNRIELNPAQTVLVIGGRGFIGRYIVEQLENFGAQVIVGSRDTDMPNQFGTRKVVLHELQTKEQCERLLNGVDVVINAVGILRQRIGETYEQVHHLAVSHLVNACARKNIRFVHVSALGLTNPTKSRFLSSKRLGELAIKNSKADWYICRPSLVDGDDGYGAKWFRRVASWPIHITPANAVAKLAPIHVKDLGEAIAKIALQTSTAKTNEERIYELGGEQQMNVLEYLQVLKKGRATLNIEVPAWIARLTSHVLDLLHLTPYSFGHYELLKFDNAPKAQKTKLLLGRRCRELGCGDSWPITAINNKIAE